MPKSDLWRFRSWSILWSKHMLSACCYSVKSYPKLFKACWIENQISIFFLSFWWQKLSTWIVRRRRWDTIGKVYRLFSTRRIDTIDGIRVPGTIGPSHCCGSPRGTPSWAITSASGSGAPAVSWRLPTLPVTGLPTRARQLPIAWARVRSPAGSWTRHLLHLRLHQCVNFGTVWMVIVGRTICKIKN